ncbi:MAG: CDP-archaeol synthase [Kiritimatiellae bacterium]|jgi:phosphatidate cytidylyltransferase|nr:CDP-archaeol synthase [Kiritimatiellia bacterium]
MRTKVITGVALGIFFACAILFLPKIFIPFFMCGLIIYALNEYYGILRSTGLTPARLIGYFFSCLLIVGTYLIVNKTPMENGLILSNFESSVLAAAIITFFLREMAIPNNTKITQNLATEVFGVFYIAFLLNFILKLGFMFRVPEDALSALPQGGRMLLLYGIATVKFSDAGAYFTGKYLGKHKLLPRVSPKKTWEGVGGGLVFAIVTSLIVCKLTNFSFGSLEFSLLDAFILPVLLTFAGLAGDLCESMLKRDTGIKDSSKDLPGMGGILDVLDSLITSLPILYIYVIYVV